MGKLVPIVVVALSIVVYFIYSRCSCHHQKVDFPKSGYFGSGQEKPDDKTIKPFKIEVPEAALTDLKNRLTSARFGHEQLEDVSDFEYGFNLKTLKVYRDYWLNKYDWRKQEKLLNTFSHFKTQIEGLNIHYIHAKPPANKYKKVIPLLIVHGWPGNVFEFYKIIPMLTDPNSNLNGVQSDTAFEVIAPSIPGYGWSDQPKKSGFNQLASARVFNKLMIDRLKFKKYLVQGGDWGSLVATNVGRMYPENLYGVHVNMLFITPFRDLKSTLQTILGSIAPTWVFSDPASASYSFPKQVFEALKETGYMHIQGTKPDTVGVGLNDSPIGLLAYILEKFSGWTNELFKNLDDGGLEKKFTKDELITMIMIYWLNGNILSSQRYYKEFFANPEATKLYDQYVSAPVGYAAFPHDLGGDSATPPEIAKNAVNLTHYARFKDGGHFAAFEVPEFLAKDVITFAKKVIS